MTAWDDQWATPQARDYARLKLADEIARAAIDAAMSQLEWSRYPNAEAWIDRQELPSFKWATAIVHARGLLDARRP